MLWGGVLSDNHIKGIFGNIDFNSTNLGDTLIKRNENLFKIMSQIKNIDLGKFEDKTIDIFGDAYEFLMGMYASKAGKSGGEYFTPQEVSRLLTLLAIGNKTKINEIYDPACGSGSLLLQAEKILGHENVRDGFYGQESEPITYNLCRMNMFLHNVNYSKFNIYLGDTLIEPKQPINKKFEVIVSNPPYSIKWKGDDDLLLLNDERYSVVGVLAPKSKADYAFILHSLHILDDKGAASIVCFPGIFYRGGVEFKIRKYLVDNNFIDLIIALPENLFYGTTISTNIMVLSKCKIGKKIMFIDASQLYVKETNQNKLSEDNIQKILKTFLQKNEIEHFSRLVDIDEIENNNYDLSVGNYVQAENLNKKEVIDINELNLSIKEISNKNNKLRNQIDLLLKELEK
ncbi:type I restriction-modification system subunit M [Mycoplasmoides pirum]|uniref:type I restriction-modification system subunit M n=1 Tax=Mycoplasmoides pirum TaxID=2122 RepID=UPI000B301C6D|nr:type I restriction-modification system subunit M [Mycoplasmoides pirum]